MRTSHSLLLLAAFSVGTVALMGCQPSSSGTGTINTEKARERGAEIGEKTAIAAAKVKESIAEGSLTAKIKAKMALDDTIKARSIDVTTNGTTVTLSGTVSSAAEHARALALTRETEGVAQVIDNLRVAR
jgi:osmotically-inducible protein OsmY